VSVVIAQACSSILTISTISNVMENIAADIRRDLFQSIQNQDLTFFEMNQTAKITKIINQDIQGK
jgi:ABC-type multidrug transport system fused ATPase/permease subunit